MIGLPFRQRALLDQPQLDPALRELMPIIAALARVEQRHRTVNASNRAEALVEALRRFQRLDRNGPALRALGRWQAEQHDSV